MASMIVLILNLVNKSEISVHGWDYSIDELSQYISSFFCLTIKIFFILIKKYWFEILILHNWPEYSYIWPPAIKNEFFSEIQKIAIDYLNPRVIIMLLNHWEDLNFHNNIFEK
jgi:hypothetical protein